MQSYINGQTTITATVPTIQIDGSAVRKETEERKVIIMNFFDYIRSSRYWCKIDSWAPMNEGERIFKNVKNAIMLPVSKYYGTAPSIAFDSFMISPKRCYNTHKVREHICHYLNYFEKFYDTDHELLLYYYRIKQMIDFGIIDRAGNTYEYTQDQFVNDIRKYILSDSIYTKVWKMNCQNYCLNLKYKNKTNEGLQYTDLHGKYLMEISFMMNVLIPLIMHFIYKKRMLNNVENFILSIYYELFARYNNTEKMEKLGLKPADIYSKLYETANTTMLRDYRSNTGLWNMCEIRGMDTTINSLDALNTLIIQVIPKYQYNSNLIMYNFTAIRNTIKYNVSEISYDFVSLSSSKRDGEDNTSQYDKFEAHLIKADESLYLQNKFNRMRTMEIIEQKFGPIDQKEIDFYIKELSKNGLPVVNKFQMKLLFNIFYKYFGDTNSIKMTSMIDYVKLIIIAKRILLNAGMIVMPYIISSNVVRLSTRNNINKKEMTKLENSEFYNNIKTKYKNPKIEKLILTTIATIISSDFDIIDYENPDLNGKRISIVSDLVIDEILCYINLI